MIKLREAFNANGSFDGELLYTTLYNKIPSLYRFELENDDFCLDPKSIIFEPVKDLFKNVDLVRIYTEESIGDKEEEEETDFEGLEIEGDIIEGRWVPEGEEARSMYIAADNMVILVVYKKISILYDNTKTLEEVKQLARTIYSRFPRQESEDKSARVGLIKYNNGDYYTSFSDIKRTNINLEENYNDDFLPVYEDVVNFLKQRESGLVLLHGKIGTGKTSLIRHLCSIVPKDYVIVPNSVASRLGDPDLVSYITSCKDYVFILEDCEQLLVDRTDNPWNNAISTILNMADGLLSDIVNIKFICTFNAEVDKIDKALLRKGRCFAKYEFKELNKEKVAKLNEKYNLGIKEIKDMTLAEIYNSEKQDYSESTSERKIGF